MRGDIGSSPLSSSHWYDEFKICTQAFDEHIHGHFALQIEIGCVLFSMPSLIEIRKSKLEKEGKKP
jgi:hypothetical protein